MGGGRPDLPVTPPFRNTPSPAKCGAFSWANEMTLMQRVRLAWQLVIGRACVTLDWGEVKAEGVPVEGDAVLVLLTHDEAARLQVKR